MVRTGLGFGEPENFHTCGRVGTRLGRVEGSVGQRKQGGSLEACSRDRAAGSLRGPEGDNPKIGQGSGIIKGCIEVGTGAGVIWPKLLSVVGLRLCHLVVARRAWSEARLCCVLLGKLHVSSGLGSPLCDGNTIVVSPHRRFCFLQFQVPTVNLGPKALNTKFQTNKQNQIHKL